MIRKFLAEDRQLSLHLTPLRSGHAERSLLVRMLCRCGGSSARAGGARVDDRRFVFEDLARDQFRMILRMQLHFSLLGGLAESHTGLVAPTAQSIL